MFRVVSLLHVVRIIFSSKRASRFTQKDLSVFRKYLGLFWGNKSDGSYHFLNSGRVYESGFTVLVFAL